MSISQILNPNGLDIYCNSIKTPLKTFTPRAFGGEVEITLNPNSSCTYQVLGDMCFFTMKVFLSDIAGVNLSDIFSVELPIVAEGTPNTIYLITLNTFNLFEPPDRYYDGHIKHGIISPSYSSRMYVDLFLFTQGGLMNCGPISINTQNIVFTFTGFYRIGEV